MNTNEAKQIRIEEYLHTLGYNPVRRQGDSLWYKSPFRDEQEPSFKVNMERNLWYDFGAGRGGNIIALARELYASDSLPYLLERIAEQAPSVRPVSFSFGGQPLSKPSFQQLEVVPLSSPALLSYLRQREINTELAKRECKEVRYLTGGKPYFAVGFPNRSGGYEIRRQDDRRDPIRSQFGKIEKEEVSLSDKMLEMKEFAKTHRKFSFRDLLKKQCSKVQVIVTFLSVLELIKMGHIHVVQEEIFDDIQINVVTEPETWKNLTEFAEEEG